MRRVFSKKENFTQNLELRDVNNGVCYCPSIVLCNVSYNLYDRHHRISLTAIIIK